MKTLRHISAAVMLLLCLSGCAEVELPQSAPQIVVEGWIEDGYHPIVMLTTTVPIGESVTDLNELKKFVINWGKVTISDGENSVVLTGRRDDDYFPPYIYTTSSMTGQAGKTYTITVESNGQYNAVNIAKEAFDIAYKKTEEVVTTQKQKLDVVSIENKRAKDFTALGEIYFNMIKDSEIDNIQVKELVDAIKEKNQKIADLKNEINATKNKRICPECDRYRFHLWVGKIP